MHTVIRWHCLNGRIFPICWPANLMFRNLTMCGVAISLTSGPVVVGITWPQCSTYAWLKPPTSPRQQEGERLTGLVKQSWLESGAVYGYRKIHCDLRDLGEACGKHRVAKLMKREGLRSQTGYQRRKGY